MIRIAKNEDIGLEALQIVTQKLNTQKVEIDKSKKTNEKD